MSTHILKTNFNFKQVMKYYRVRVFKMIFDNDKYSRRCLLYLKVIFTLFFQFKKLGHPCMSFSPVVYTAFYLLNYKLMQLMILNCQTAGQTICT